MRLDACNLSCFLSLFADYREFRTNITFHPSPCCPVVFGCPHPQCSTYLTVFQGFFWPESKIMFSNISKILIMVKLQIPMIFAPHCCQGPFAFCPNRHPVHKGQNFPPTLEILQLCHTLTQPVSVVNLECQRKQEWCFQSLKLNKTVFTHLFWIPGKGRSTAGISGEQQQTGTECWTWSCDSWHWSKLRLASGWRIAVDGEDASAQSPPRPHGSGRLQRNI